MAAELTLVLAARGRLPFTLRWLAFARRLRLDLPVIVADGGEGAEAQALERACAESGLPISYMRRSSPDLSALYARLADALATVRTPLVALVANDDFPEPDGLRRCARFLAENPSYSSCGGRLGTLLVRPRPGELDPGVYSANPEFGGGALIEDVGEKTALERVVAQLDRYYPTWYDVHHKSGLASAISALSQAKMTDAALPELLQSLLGAAAGPIKRLDHLTMVRQCDVPGSTSSGTGAAGDLLDEMTAAAWGGEFNALVAALAEDVARRDGAGATASAGKAIRAAYARYARRTLASTAQSCARSALRQKVKSALPAPLREAARWASRAGAGRWRPLAREERFIEHIRAVLAAPPEAAGNLLK